MFQSFQCLLFVFCQIAFGRGGGLDSRAYPGPDVVLVRLRNLVDTRKSRLHSSNYSLSRNTFRCNRVFESVGQNSFLCVVKLARRQVLHQFFVRSFPSLVLFLLQSSEFLFVFVSVEESLVNRALVSNTENDVEQVGG